MRRPRGLAILSALCYLKGCLQALSKFYSFCCFCIDSSVLQDCAACLSGSPAASLGSLIMQRRACTNSASFAASCLPTASSMASQERSSFDFRLPLVENHCGSAVRCWFCSVLLCGLAAFPGSLFVRTTVKTSFLHPHPVSARILKRP